MAEKKNQTTAKIEKKENPSENIVEIKPAGKPDVNIEAELVKLGNSLDKGDLKGAEAKVSVLMKRNIRAAKLFSFAGKIKFIKKDFSAAESLWVKSLKLNGSINFRFFHKHGIFNKGCSGELIIKKGLIIFDSLTKPSHSLALTIDRIRKIQKPRSSYGIVVSYLSGKKTKKSVLILRGRNRRGEKFLVEFLNKYILEDK